ncbi:MAG: 50S ribosomal protein L18e [Thermoprotei archaeon]|nr:MAG: 50S ribosomal protein L18e [Thermoprotei archaeon]
MRRTGPTNIVLRKTIRALYKIACEQRANIWRAVAEELERPHRRRRAVNISRINRYTEPGDTVVVPGKVLGAGRLEHPVTIAAIGFSRTALEKIKAVGGQALHILELASKNPRGSNVKIIG